MIPSTHRHPDTRPPGEVWSEILGEFYDRRGVASLLAIDETRVESLALQDKVLELRTTDGVPVYPAFQFCGAVLLPGLASLLGAVSGAVDSWTLTAWLVTSQPLLTELSVVDYLRSYGFDERMADVAAATAEHWSR